MKICINHILFIEKNYILLCHAFFKKIRFIYFCLHLFVFILLQLYIFTLNIFINDGNVIAKFLS